MTTFFDATLAVARKLGVIRTGVIDSGDTVTLVDAAQRIEVDDTFNGGTVWITWDAGDSDAAPQGEYAEVSDFVNSTATVTFDALTSAVGAGDRYAIATARFPLDMIKTAINDELINYKAPRYDATSLDAVSAQSEYTLPAGIDRYNLINVYESTNDDSNDNRWVPLKFEVQPAEAGSQHTLIIKSRRVGIGNDFLLEYNSWVQPLENASDTIDESIPLPRLVVKAAAQTVLIVMQTYNSGNELDMELWKMLSKQAEDAERRYPIRPVQTKGRVQQLGDRRSGNWFTYPSTE